MFKKAIFIGISILLSAGLAAQRSAIELTITADSNGTYIKLDSIKVINITRLCDTILYWPDTVLTFNLLGIPGYHDTKSGFHLFQNYPNPVADLTGFDINLPEKGILNLQITDPLGREITSFARELEKGMHNFSFKPGNASIYFITARYKNEEASIKILHPSSTSANSFSLEYIGIEHQAPALKASEEIQYECFNYGDELLFIGYSGVYNSGFLDTLKSSENYAFQFAYNIPCPEMPTITYEGQVYNTVQIFSQCWLKENLNVGTMIPGTMEQLNNGTIEKYCYNNEPDSCDKYGGLYSWNELMQYVTYQQGARGICPPGWHLPQDLEWKILEGVADSQYGVADPEWDNFQSRGYDAGINLKSSHGWMNNGNGVDLLGFAGLPAGGVNNNGFSGISASGSWSSSTYASYDRAIFRALLFLSQKVSTGAGFRATISSVRCVKDL
jgi:uncharacterized protein (TIGR02145 family)